MIFRRLRRRSEGGFSFVELMLVVSMTGVIMLAIGAAIDVGVNINFANQKRFAGAQALQYTATMWIKDVHHSEHVYNNATGECGTSTPLATFTWNDGYLQTATWGYQTVSGDQQLVRSFCHTDATGTTTATTVIAHNVPNSVLAVACVNPTTCGIPDQVNITIPGANPGEVVTLIATRTVS